MHSTGTGVKVHNVGTGVDVFNIGTGIEVPVEWDNVLNIGIEVPTKETGT